MIKDSKDLCNTRAMKQVLFDKLQSEGCYFTMSDISIKKQGNAYKIVIKDYEHIPFLLEFEMDDYFGFVVWLYRLDEDEKQCISMIDSKYKYRVNDTMLQLGYYIASRF